MIMDLQAARPTCLCVWPQAPTRLRVPSSVLSVQRGQVQLLQPSLSSRGKNQAFPGGGASLLEEALQRVLRKLPNRAGEL